MNFIPRSPMWISYAAWGCVAGGVLHLAAIIGGADWFDFLGAPPSYGEALRAGEWMHAVLTTLGIVALLFIWAAYAFSARPGRTPLPLAKFVCAAVAFIFLLRGALGIPFVLYLLVTIEVSVLFLFHLAASVFVFTLGLGFARAYCGLKIVKSE